MGDEVIRKLRERKRESVCLCVCGCERESTIRFNKTNTFLFFFHKTIFCVPKSNLLSQKWKFSLYQFLLQRLPVTDLDTPDEKNDLKFFNMEIIRHEINEIPYQDKTVMPFNAKIKSDGDNKSLEKYFIVKNTAC